MNKRLGAGANMESIPLSTPKSEATEQQSLSFSHAQLLAQSRAEIPGFQICCASCPTPQDCFSICTVIGRSGLTSESLAFRCLRCHHLEKTHTRCIIRCLLKTMRRCPSGFCLVVCAVPIYASSILLLNFIWASIPIGSDRHNCMDWR